jgi:hypothetical protein
MGGHGVDDSVETTSVERVLRQRCDLIGAIGKVAVIGAGPNASLRYEVSEFIRKGTQIACMGGGIPQQVRSLEAGLLILGYSQAHRGLPQGTVPVRQDLQVLQGRSCRHGCACIAQWKRYQAHSHLQINFDRRRFEG